MGEISGVLMVGAGKSEFGADQVNNYQEAVQYLGRRKPSVVVFGGAKSGDTTAFCQTLLKESPFSEWIVCSDGVPPSQLVQWSTLGRLHDLIEDFSDPTLEQKVQSAVETAGARQQNLQLQELFAEQTLQLKRLQAELEARVQRRHRSLRKSLRTLEETKIRMEAFHRALLGIHRAATVPQMENTLNEALQATIKVASVRIRLINQSSLSARGAPHMLSVEIPLREEGLRFEVIFAQAAGQVFTEVEIDFLQELSEALALALARLHKLEQAETLKAQWQATFDSIPHSLCLVSRDFEILKLNLAFQQQCSRHSFHSLLGKNCFKVFFANDFRPPPTMESPFTFRNARVGAPGTEHFEVVGETLGTTVDHQPVQLIVLRSITDEVRFERRIFEASKLAELGTIGSSIAHELNNPLGGMLSFLQLLLMDIKPKDPLHAEIKEMEQAVLRCRDIVLNLLSFARKQDLGEFSSIDLRAVVTRSVKLIELQSKSMGVTIDVHADAEAMVSGNVNALSQALCNILQNSLDAIGDKLKAQAMFPGKITLRIDARKGQYDLAVSDNGTGIRPEIQSKIFNPLFTTRDPDHFGGMGLTTAYTIVNEHHGTLEILSQTGSGTTAIVSIPQLSSR